MSSVHNKRKMGDLQKLVQSGLKVIGDTIEDDTYYVCIKGPKETPYEDGFYWLRMYITKDYPFKSPSVIFLTPIFHPNVEYDSGTICLDAINEQWTPVFHFERIFQIMIPHLMTYPNASDPFHVYAAELLLQNSDKYNEIAKKINEKYATDGENVPFHRIERNSIDFD
jgi:ubiquitin-conjugating enzyme E2 H